MALEVDILSVIQEDNELQIAVSVSTESTDTIDYELNINDTGTTGTVTRRGTLAGGAGSYPGDANIESVDFGVADTPGGLVTAQITEPEEYVGVQDQQEWGDQGGGSGIIEINSCSAEATTGGDLRASYSLAPTDLTGGDATITVRVDGVEVGSADHYVPDRGGGFSQTIPADDLPVGRNLPVEIGVGGNFSDCGTVSTEADDPDPEPADPRIVGCSITSEDPLRVRIDVDGDGSQGDAIATVRVAGRTVAQEPVSYTLNPTDHTIEVPTSELPVGTEMPVTISL